MMYKLIRIFNQNRKQIIKVILIIVFAFGILQLLNQLEKIKRTSQLNNVSSENISNNINNNKIETNSLISDKSLISGGSISSSKLNEDKELIDLFMYYCNNKDIDKAYELISEECKSEMFPSLEDFDKYYYGKIFNGQEKNHTVENWINDIYTVRITDDILSTGKIEFNSTKQDYITVKDKKLNLNNYIGNTQINKKTTKHDISITVKDVNTYMNYQVYNLVVENNSKNTILLDTNDDVNSIYILDNNDMKYYFYNNEFNENKTKIESGFTYNIQIKFMNTYNSQRKIKSLVFSKMILDYDENNNDFYIFKVDI